MRQFHTAVVERKETVAGTFTTHPFEAAWASEAIFFVRIEEAGAALNAAVQISADGVRWVDEGTRFNTLQEKGDYFVRVSHFGGWLRLHIELEDSLEKGEAKGETVITVQLALKE